MNISHIEHVGIAVPSLDEAIPFYEKIGMSKPDDVMTYNRIEWTDFKVE